VPQSAIPQLNGCANLRLAHEVTTLIPQLEALDTAVSDARNRLKVIETAVLIADCADEETHSADDSECRQSVESLLADRQKILDNLHTNADTLACVTSNLRDDTTTASDKLFFMFRDIEDELHNVKKLLNLLRNNNKVLASQALEDVQGPLNRVCYKAIELRQAARDASNLTVFGAEGLRKIKATLVVLAVSATTLCLAFCLDAHVFSLWSAHPETPSVAQNVAVGLSIVGALSGILSVGYVLDFWQHVARCKDGPAPYEMVWDKQQLAYAKAVIAAFEAAAQRGVSA
jgi:AhpD family alkylhydroperoxidase